MHNPHTYAPTSAEEVRESDRLEKITMLAEAKALAYALESKMIGAESHGAFASQKQPEINKAIVALTDIIQPLIAVATMDLEDEL